MCYNDYRKLRKEVITMTEKQLCKRALIVIIIWAIVSVLVVIGTNLIATATHTRVEDLEQTNGTYVLHTQVVGVDYEADVVACVDTVGNVWEFYGVEDWQEGDFAVLTMNTNGTKTIYDDEIASAVFEIF